MLRPVHFFDLSKCKYPDLFDGIDFVWDALKQIPDFIKAKLKPGIHCNTSPMATMIGDIYIGAGTRVEPGVVIKGPAMIGSNCEIRAGAYIRGNVIIGDDVVVGHTTELKHCMLFDKVTVPHFSYVGDSILGWKVHLGAGVKISNFKINSTPVVVKLNNQLYDTGLLKFGAILGDEVEIGCNTVLNPGTLIGKRTLVYANASILGYYPPDCIVKLRQSHEVVDRKSKK